MSNEHFHLEGGNNYKKSNSGGMRNGRSDMGMGQMRSNGHQGAGMGRRWDSAGASNDHQNKRPYQQNSNFGSGPANGVSSGAGYQQKSFRPNSYENKPALSAPGYQQQSYAKFSGYPQMQMQPSLAQYSSPIASAVANYTFPPPQSSVMPPLPKN